jgi:hypothetical protein
MDALMIETDTLCNKFQQADELSLCPECGAVMDEVDRLTEGECVYIWLECSKSACDGQWLQKKSNYSFIGA